MCPEYLSIFISRKPTQVSYSASRCKSAAVWGEVLLQCGYGSFGSDYSSKYCYCYGNLLGNISGNVNPCNVNHALTLTPCWWEDNTVFGKFNHTTFTFHMHKLLFLLKKICVGTVIVKLIKYGVTDQTCTLAYIAIIVLGFVPCAV